MLQLPRSKGVGMRTCGIDIATCTGMALVGEDEDRGKTIHLPDQRGFLRLQLIAKQVEETLRVWDPDLVLVEGYAYCKNISAFVVLVELGTVIRQVLYNRQVDWVTVPPSTLKQWTTGKGNASKEMMAVSVKQRWHYTSNSHDIIDAFALAQMGQSGVEQALKIKGVEKGDFRLTPSLPSL